MRVKLVIEYLGTNYSGWQNQKDANSVQAEVEKAIKATTGEVVSVEASGRTDKGVHARAQIAHFDTDTVIPTENLFKAINQKLPSDIRIRSSTTVSNDFHARFNTKRKTYCYNFYVSEIARPLLDSTYAHIKPMFDYTTAQMCIPYFVGTHDFRAFMSTGSDKENTTRTVFDCSLSHDEASDSYSMRITGNGFLYNMVRIIAGTVIAVGAGKIKPNDVANIIARLDRTRAGTTAPAAGLVLESVEYE